MASDNSNTNPKETYITVDLSNNKTNKYSNNIINGNNNDNNNESNNKPIGEPPVPIGKESIHEESKNSLDDYEVEEIE